MFFAKNAIRLTVCCRHPWISQNREIKRWAAPVIREFNKRKRKMGPEPLRPRSSFTDWNYKAELYAFKNRLKEEFDLDKLQQAFIHQSYIMQEELKQKQLGVDEPIIHLNDNREFVSTGEILIQNYVSGFLQYSLPRMRSTLLDNICKNITSDTALAEIASNLGMGDLIFSSDFPAKTATLADTFKAVVGSLLASCGEEKTNTFIRDLVCTQLSQRDLTEVCAVENPFEELKLVCKQGNMGDPEARLIGESAKTTVLAVFNIGIYCDRKLIGRGFGESIASAKNSAAYDALRELWGFPENMQPLNFDLQIQSSFTKQLKRAS